VRCYTLGADGHALCEYRGGPTSFSSRLALNEQTPQLELIQPLRGPSAHRDWLDERGEGHTMSASSWSRCPLPQPKPIRRDIGRTSGCGIGPKRNCAWAYIDTSEAPGSMVEAVEPPTSMPPIEIVWPRERVVSEAEAADRDGPAIS
jgi:hypothetical protein